MKFFLYACIFFATLISLSSFTNKTFTSNTTSPIISQIETTQLSITERKKGRIIHKTSSLTTIDSDDGNEYTASASGGYKVDDYVFHSDPVAGAVVILGYVE